MPGASMQQQQQNRSASRQMEGDAIIIISSGAGFGGGGGTPPAFPASRSDSTSAPARDWGGRGRWGAGMTVFCGLSASVGLGGRQAATSWNELEGQGIGLAAASGLAVRHRDAYSLGYHRWAMDG